MSPILSLPYHQPAFILLGKLFQDETRYELTRRFAKVRGRLFLERFQPNVVIESEFAWECVKEILDCFDGELRALISTRSVAYWLHIYRRIGVFLSPDHEDKTDHVTTGLVRQIAELAIHRHGLQTAPKEFGVSNRLSPDLILGGWMKKGLKGLQREGISGEKIYRGYSRLLKTQYTWVIRDFSKRDFLNIYAIEGAAYQYWRLTALLRSVGKGAKITIDDTGDWEYVPDDSLHRLILSIDERNKRRNSISSLTGIWIDSETLMGRGDEEEEGSDQDVVFFPVYNTSRVELTDDFKTLGVRFPDKNVPNFFPLYLRANKFFEHHDFMREEFSRRRGYDFNSLVQVLVGLSSFSILPNRALYAKNEEERNKIKLSAFMQTLSRGYHLFVGSREDLLEMLIERLSAIFSTTFDREEVRGVLSSITLRDEVQGRIAPWSNGPRSVVIPAGEFCLVDLVSVPALLSSIFAFMSDRLGERGTVFERLFREALGRRGFGVKSGKLEALDGSERELDAGVIVDGRMYLFECVSIERPLDFEIGRPRTMAVRKERLSQKLAQAKSLHEFVSGNPTGRNYDFSETKEFVWIVVSPFVEWIWDWKPELWLDSKTPRILAPNEAFSLLGADDG